MTIASMRSGYSQFCPVAKASEIFATRWTPLVVRELLFGSHAFNDIHRGVPLMSRALLVERLRQLEEWGIVEKRCAEIGRHASEIERSVPWPGVDQAAAYADAGVTLFTVGASGPDYDLAPLIEAIGWRDENSPPPL